MIIKSVLMIGNYLSSPRHNRNVWQGLSERLPECGWEVLMTSSKETKAIRLLDMLWMVFSKRNDYSLAQIDVFSGQAFYFAECCSLLLSLLNKPFVLTLHGGGLPEFSERYPKRVHHLLKRAQIVVTPSPFIQKGLKAYRSDIRIIPNPIDLSSSIYRVRKKAAPNLIWVRAFHDIYNPRMVPKVISELAPAFPDVHISMIGPDKEDGSLVKMINITKDLDIEDKIEIIGGVKHDDIPSLLDKADIFINTTNYDTFPLSLLEAMANGLCIISTNVGGIPYLINSRESGLLVPPNDPIKMASSVKLVINNPDIAKTLSTNARKRAEEFDWSLILPLWEKTFTELLENQNWD